MRTPTEVFEAVLDAWDDDVRNGFRILDEHRAKAAAYREEFRQAMALLRLAPEPPFGVPKPIDRQILADHAFVDNGFGRCAVLWNGPGGGSPMSLVCGRSREAHVSTAPLSPPDQALADANPSTYVPPEPTASAEEAFAGTCPPAFGAGLVLPPGWTVKPPRVGLGDHNLRPPCESLSLTVSGPPPTLDAEILQEPPPLPELIDTLKEKLREAGVLRSRAEDLLQESRHRLEETVGDRAFDDEEFRRRPDESAERYTRADGSER